MKVLPRIETDNDENRPVILFFPYISQKNGYIVCWCSLDGHSVADIDYFLSCKLPVDTEQYAVNTIIKMYEKGYGIKLEAVC